MSEDNRLNLDEIGSEQTAAKNLLEDVAAAAQMAKERKDKDKAQAQKDANRAKDRTTMTIIVVAATVILLAIAYWSIFVRGENKPFAQSGDMNTNQPAPVYRPGSKYAPVQQTNPNVRPVAPKGPISEPIKRNPSETYDEGPGAGGM